MGLIRAIKSGWHEGKGHKCRRKEDFRGALERYILALNNSENEGGKPVLMEYIAKSHISLCEYAEALNYAQESYDLYKKQENISPIFKDGLKRMAKLIEKIKEQKET